MKLKDFIKKLEEISRSTNNSDKIDVLMADNIPVIEPILKDDMVFITDQKR